MTNPVILLGTQSNGETLPVQVDATGRLVAEGLPGPQGEQGIQGEPGPKGDKGDDGGLELPPNPQEGDVLGWKDGQLAWIGEDTSFDAEFVLIGGGGSGIGQEGFYSGGGAGGYLSNVQNERSGGNSDPLPLLSLNGPDLFNVSIGGPSEQSIFSGVDSEGTPFEFIALSGNQGSGSGAINENTPPRGTPGQGSPGGRAAATYSDCFDPNNWVSSACDSGVRSGGGGGAGDAGLPMIGGPGIQSSITGTPTYYAGGGGGQELKHSDGVGGEGHDNFGGGGLKNGPGVGGALIITHPISLIADDNSTGLTMTTTLIDDKKAATTISAGSGQLTFRAPTRQEKLQLLKSNS